MSVLLDKQYANMLSTQLEGFKWSRSMLAICRCPMCGDSNRKTNKRRFYIYRNTKDGLKDYLSVHCHNCGYGNPFGRFLKEYDSGLYASYRMELFREMGWGRKEAPKEEPEQAPEPEIFTEAIDGCVSLLELPEDHFCVRYVAGRRIPKSEWGRLWFAEDFRAACETFSDDDETTNKLPENDPRLVIPFKDPFGSVTCVQGRALNASKMRYITIKQTANSSKVFGEDRLDNAKPIYVVEGPIDSLFIPNCVATADSYLAGYTRGSVMVHDNQPRNREVCKQINNSIEAGKQVVLWPDWVHYKDVNDMVKEGGLTPAEVMGLIQSNLYSGLKAKLEFVKWKKI